MSVESLWSGDNAAWLDQRWRAWLADPNSVDPEWQQLFSTWEKPTTEAPAPPPPIRRSIFNAAAQGPGVSATAVIEAAHRQAKVAQLINAYRVRGHAIADIDPLGSRARPDVPELTLDYYGLTDLDLNALVSSAPLYGLPKVVPVKKVLERLRQTYCGTLGAEYMNIPEVRTRWWIQERLETLPDNPVLDKVTATRFLRKLCDGENLERLLHNRFPGTKRFSIEGGETLIPLLDLVLTHAARRGVLEVVIGMAHRGRLNTLVNVLDKPVGQIIREFEDVRADQFQGSGDVKYHLGYSSDYVTPDGHPLHLSLTPNPSHLEAVDPVVEGRVRAKQERAGDHEHRLALPLLIHGDAAFAGQGLVAETLNLSDLHGYRTGGTVHVIVNNQIGFTTTPTESRSTPYATDVARMLGVPIFHVNGEDPSAVSAVVAFALEWRQTFHRDVVIDLYCYRKHGHNEGDEPSFTQPRMYASIRTRPTPRQVSVRRLLETGLLDQAEADSIAGESRADLEKAGPLGSATGGENSMLRAIWDQHQGSISEEVDTSVPLARWQEILTAANTLPPGFQAHPKLLRLLAQRLEMVSGTRPIDWAVGEQAALATLTAEGRRVRLSGQDSSRGTFSHRHAVLTDVESGDEYGYSIDYPEALVLWEAQFGDFANGAQVIIDQFIAAGEQKWNRRSGLVLLLPHGFEGQGPEHSSARLERYLQLCAEDNVQVANCTTPASFFHLLRRQVLRHVRKPLVVMTPKSLLRHPEAVSSLADFSDAQFQRILVDRIDPAAVRRVVLCSGKVFYELDAFRKEHGITDVAVHRVELLHPWPHDEIEAEITRCRPDVEVTWCQEEPENMGAWPIIRHWFLDRHGRSPRYAGRKAAASPATGSHEVHEVQQHALLEAALR